MKNLKNFVQYNEEGNWRDNYPTVGSLKAKEEAEDKKWFNIGDDSMDNEEESGIQVYTVEELFDIDDENQHIEVIKLDDLSDEQKEYLGIKEDI
jgi:hypothetical protein